MWRFRTGPRASTVSIDDDPVVTASTSDTFLTTTNAVTSSPSSEAHDSDRSWARRQAAEAQNHIFDSLGERYGLRIILGRNSFLVLLNNISRSTAVGTILHPGGPACSPLGGSAGVGDADYDGYWSSVTIEGSTGRTTSSTGGRVSSAEDSTHFVFIMFLVRCQNLDSYTRQASTHSSYGSASSGVPGVNFLSNRLANRRRRPDAH
ncbi:hypothetical protein EDD16DRAFT_121566 [Pisolithus croceorrhizus]|nr:hypothetical protein EDD16DRAFT_121566 [Pisolithus croceorrhizus]KAI6167823.1 hypothetical protein EDD17DRAFT_864848 [Pisolithus thermaeus]